MSLWAWVAIFFSISAPTFVFTTDQQASPDAQSTEGGPGEPVSPEALREAIDRLSSLDYPVRMNAARLVRRAPAANAVPVLLQTVDEHSDGWVRYKALVLLTGFNDPRTRDPMLRLIDDPNDRLRGVAYRYFEHHPDPTMVPRLLRALEGEPSEFVRPALVRALAAHTTDLRVRETLVGEVGRGEDFFRGGVIEALGDYRAQYAIAELIRIARLEGPLQDDSALALGKIGDRRALATLATLQREAPRESQPAIAAAICLIGVNCPVHLGYIADTVRFATAQPGFQPLLRGAAQGLAALGSAGNAHAIDVLLDVGIPTRDPARAPIALALGTVALRNPSLTLRILERRSDPDGSLLLLREAFDMLEEDFEEERFYATVRRGYWQAAEASRTRTVAEALIGTLEF